MKHLDLEQLEADLVIVVRNPDEGRIHVYPFWECDTRGEAVEVLAARLALQAVEADGGGYGVAEIHDFRDAPAE